MSCSVLWPGESPIGKCIIIGPSKKAQCTLVVGVAEDARESNLKEVTVLQYYISFAQSDSVFSSGPSSLIVRTAGPAGRYEGDVRRAIQGTDSYLPYPNVDPMPRLYANQLRP
jgi:hypothetical protein